MYTQGTTEGRRRWPKRGQDWREGREWVWERNGGLKDGDDWVNGAEMGKIGRCLILLLTLSRH
jgi:hypothetical protein